MTLLSKQISYPAGDTTVPGILYLPGDQADCAAVIVFHGSDGFKSNHEMIARRLAKEGFAALALTWFGGGSSRSLWSAVRAEDILQATAFLEQQPGVDADRLGLIGFSRGGGLALIMAALIPQTKAVDFIQKLCCPVLSFHGEKDTVVPAGNTIALDAACKKYGIDHRYILYPGVNHSFIWPGDKYDRKAHLDSWDKTLRFLKTNLNSF